MSRNASSFEVPWPKNAGDEPIASEVAAAEDDPRDRDPAAAEEALLHAADPTLRAASGTGSVRANRRGSSREDRSDDLRRRRRPLRPDAVQPLRRQRPRRCPAISLGLWHNFGGVDPLETGRAIVRRAFDLGVTHFDLANNYGPPYGSAEESFGRMLRDDLRPYRDELIISTKAGYDMWPGPYGDGGSRKYLLASLDQSLARLGLDYVDIFYSHRFDPATPLEETMGALDSAVRQGKALYVGHLVLLGGADARGRRDPARPRHAPPDPPALVLAAEPVDRAGSPRHARRARRRLHHLLAARAGASSPTAT